MLTSMRGLIAATALAGAFVVSGSAMADEAAPPADFTVTGNVALVTDYRFRGLSLTAGDPAVQGSINVNHSSGLYAGVWASNLEQDAFDIYGNMELDVYAGWTGKIAGGVTADVGLLYYVYPSGSVGDGNVFEPYASLSTTLGPVTGKVGVAYAWKQDSLGGSDNLYLYTDLSAAIPSTPITLSGHLGYTDGALSPKSLSDIFVGDPTPDTDGGFDYSIGATANVTKNLSVGVSYVGVEGRSVNGYSDDTVVATVKYSF